LTVGWHVAWRRCAPAIALADYFDSCRSGGWAGTPVPWCRRRPGGRPPAARRAGLEGALKAAVPTVRVPCPPLDGGPERYARWGEQLDVDNITGDRDNAAEELSGEQVASYIAKYATKANESLGAGLDRRLAEGDIAHLERLPAHVAELIRAAWELGGRPELEGLRLRAWAHMLGFGGHWSTKSRRYSTTFTVLRRARIAFAKRRRAATASRWMPGAGPRTSRP
jgi:hypothetical protein